jgi:hypothetical protein
MYASLLKSLQYVVLTADYALDYYIVDPRPEQVHVNAHRLQVLAERAETPLVALVVLLERLILNEVVVFLVNGVIRQVHVFIVL